LPTGSPVEGPRLAELELARGTGLLRPPAQIIHPDSHFPGAGAFSLFGFTNILLGSNTELAGLRSLALPPRRGSNTGARPDSVDADGAGGEGFDADETEGDGFTAASGGNELACEGGLRVLLALEVGAMVADLPVVVKGC
jgi:hypothetical protein